MSEYIAGYCPACGTKNTLFVGAGGHITCSLDRCMSPTAVADLLTPDQWTWGPAGPSTIRDLDRNNITWAADLMQKRDTISQRKKGALG